MSLFRFRLLCSVICLVALVEPEGRATTGAFTWPEVTAETKPWSRWWWLGDIVDEKSVTTELESYARVGLGGLELTPIYGVRGEEDRFIPFLSPEWMRQFEHTLAEARRLGLGIDLANGTGWPFGGPWLGDSDVAHYLAHRIYSLPAGERLHEPIRFDQAGLVRYAGPTRTPLAELRQPITDNPNLQELAIDQVRFAQTLPLVSLMAFSSKGDLLDLTSKVNPHDELGWVAPPDHGTWTLYALFQGQHGKMVERAAPGAEGFALDHFSSTALHRYLVKFDAAFAELPRSLRPVGLALSPPSGADGEMAGVKPAPQRQSGSALRGFFNDSYEVDDSQGEADFTPRFLDEFQKRRGYDLRTQLPAFFDPNDSRVISDYRETISDLLLDEFTVPWREWAHRHGAIVRNQAHGSPANILDLYAASDIPEQEGNGLLAMKLASSAAHLTGKRLTSSETGTWLDEHFRSTLAELKNETDQFFLGGINHQCYHGTAFSPLAEPWPGFQFYASVELNPRNPFWDDFAAVNAYVTRVQSFLQAGEPDEDVLLYYNIYDRWAQRGDGRMPHFGHGRDPLGTNVAETAAALRKAGVSFDFVSDRLLHEQSVGRYRAIVVPPTTHMPRDTLARLVELAESGMKVLFMKQLPSAEPGLAAAALGRDGSPSRPVLAAASKRLDDVSNGRVGEVSQPSSFSDLLRTIREHQTNNNRVATSQLGHGQIVVADTLDALLAPAPSVPHESMIALGLEYVRRQFQGAPLYFIVNRSGERIERWVPLAKHANAAVLFDPMTGRSGVAATRAPASTNERTAEVFLELEPNASVIIRTFGDKIDGPNWPYWRTTGQAHVLAGEWTVEFVKGGPSLPPLRKTPQLSSWTEFDGDEFKAFSGTARYTLVFPRPPERPVAWALDLGEIADSARVVLNGKDLGTLVEPPWRIELDPTPLQATNTLEIFVTNLAANRIADLDRRGVRWKKFYNTNFPARRRENTGPDGLFSAAKWSPRISGLLGPVNLQPLVRFDPTTR